MTKVFISYSRKDIEFAKRLTEELQKSSLEFWVDWEGIPPTVDWMKKIQSGIEESDVFLFLLSPDSAKSKVCGEEVTHAIKSGKRLIPLIVRDIKPQETSQELSHLNWIFFRKKDKFEESYQKLLVGITTDFEWVDVHSRLLVRALEWKRGGNDRSFLLRGKDLRDAETQLAINTSKDPHPTDLHREYILESRQAADSQRRWFTVLIVAAAIVMFALGVYGLREAKRANENQQRELIAKNHAQAKEFESKINQLSALAVTKIDQNFNQALLLGVEAYRHTEENGASNFTPQDAISTIIQSNPGLIHTLIGHTDWVNVVAVSPDGNLLASGSYDSTVILWDISNPAFPVKLSTITEHTSSVGSVAFSSDGKKLASNSNDAILLWDISDPLDPKLLSKISGSWATSLIFTRDSRALATIKYDDNGTSSVMLINIADANSPVELSPLENDNENTSAVNIALNAARNLLYVSLNNGNILQWDITDTGSPARLLALANDTTSDEDIIVANTLAISPDGRTLAAANSDTTITLWDIADPAAPAKLSFWGSHSLFITSLAFSPDGNTLASSSEESKTPIILWDISNRKVPKKIRTLSGHSLTITSVTFNKSSEILVSGSRDGTIMLWDVIEPKTPIQSGFLNNSYYPFALIPNSNLLSTGSAEGTVEIWNISNPALPDKIKDLDEAYNLVAFSPDGKLFASSDGGPNVVIWDSLEFVKLKTLKANNEYTGFVAFIADGKTLATAGDKFILWDVTDPKKPVSSADLTQQYDGITNMVFSPDGKFRAVIEEKTITLWDFSNPANPAKLITLEGHANNVLSVAFSPNNSLLASASADKTIILWDLKDPRNPQNINTLSDHSDWVENVVFSPDGSMLASGSDDQQINLWNISNPSAPILISKLTGHTGVVTKVSFSPLANLIVSWGYDSRIIFWDINPESWAQQACSISGGDLTIIEWKQFFPAEEYRPTCEPFKTVQVVEPGSAEGGGGTLVEVTPTVEQPAVLLPVCEADQSTSCDLPASKQLDWFCVDDNAYGLYTLPVNTTFEVLTPGFTCINEEVNSLGEPRISCTGPTFQNFEVSFCNSACSTSAINVSDQCQTGYGLDSSQGCCAPLTATNSGCITETLILPGCK